MDTGVARAVESSAAAEQQNPNVSPRPYTLAFLWCIQAQEGLRFLAGEERSLAHSSNDRYYASNERILLAVCQQIANRLLPA